MEPRAALGVYDSGSGVYTLRAGTQGVHLVRNVLAKHVLKVPARCVRVVTPDVGGAFGVKLWVYPGIRARALRRARTRPPGKVGWGTGPRPWRAITRAATSDRARRSRSNARRAVPGIGSGECRQSRRLRVPTTGLPSPPRAAPARSPDPTGLPVLHVRVRAAYTNTAPTDAYRGAGRPENVYLLERLIDKAAQRARPRPRRAAPPQSRRRRRHALPHVARADLRFR